MNWYVERVHLSQNKSLLNRNSQLKKKMNLVKKVKNLHGENIEILLNELSAENMEQFYSEIIELVLNLKISSLEEVKNVIRIISIYSRDLKFTNMFFANITASVNNNNIYWHKIIAIELQIIIDHSYKYKRDVVKLFENAPLEHKIYYIEYIMNLHEDPKLLEFANIEKAKLGTINMNFFKNKDIERITNSCKVINIEIIEQKTDNDFKHVIDAGENEFEFYNCRCIGDDKFSVPRYAKDIVEYLKNNSLKVNKIDEISKYLRKSENVKMIPILYNKLKHNMCYIPALARIIKNCGVICKKSVNKLIDDIFENRISNRTDIINGIFLISELIKFKYVGPNECFNLLEHFYRHRDIEICCLILKNIGRFYLIDEQVNFRARNFLDKIITYGNRCSSMDCVYINDMITKIFPKHHINMEENLVNFTIYYFQNTIFKKGGDVDNIFSKNRKFIFNLLCTPWRYKDIDFLCKISQHFSLDIILIDFFTFVIGIIKDSYKLKTIAYTKFLSGLLRRKDLKIQENVINTIKILDIKKDMKMRIMIYLISGMTYCTKTRHLPFLKKESEKIKSIEIQNLLFNLCESIGEKYDTIVDEDSFEKEIRIMENL